MLQAAPDAFFTQYADVAELDEATWRGRIAAQCHFQARLDDDPVGSVGLWDDPETPDDASTLVAMYVAPARARRRGRRTPGAGGLRGGRGAGGGRVVLEVTEGNDPAIGLYRRMGFDFDGTRHPFPRKPHLQELGMERGARHPGPRGRQTTWEADAMTDVTVRSLGEDDWREFRAIRLAALRDSPDAFAASVDDEEGFEEDFWRLRVRRSTRLVAVRREARAGRGPGGRRRQPRSGQGRGGPGRGDLRPLGGPGRAGHRASRRSSSRPARSARAATAARTSPTGSAPTTAARWPSPAGSGSAPPTSGVRCGSPRRRGGRRGGDRHGPPPR